MGSRFRRLVILLLIASLVAACASSGSSSEGRSESEAPGFANAPPAGAPMEEPAAEEAPAEGGAVDGGTAAGGGGDAVAQAQVERKIIYTVNISLRVADTATAADQVAAIATTLGGYVANTNLYQGSNEQLEGSVTIRVDSERLDAAMEQIRALSTEPQPLSERRDSSDVTEEYVDLTSRLENLQRTEEELRALLTEIREETRRAEDVLAVYRELTTIRGEIEQVQGRLNYLDNLATLATVTVTLYPPEAIVRDPGWSPGDAFTGALSTLVSGLQFLFEAAVYLLVGVLPLLLLLLLPLAALVWLINRWRRRRAVRVVPS